MLQCSYPVKNYSRGIADFFGVILLKRRRIAAKCPLYGRDKAVEWMGVDGRFWNTYTYVYIYIGIWAIYTYVALLIGANNNCEDNCVCVANNNCEGDIYIVAFTIIGYY